MATVETRSAVALEHEYSRLKNRSREKPHVSEQRAGVKEQTRVVELPGDENDLYNYNKLAKTTFSLLPYSTIGWVLSSIYYAWAQTSILQKQAAINGWGFESYARQGFLILDLVCTAPNYLKLFGDAMAILKGKWRPRLRAIGNDVPAVDVAIVCCNEPLEIILDTIRAVLNIDYPDGQFRLVISDDGDQPEVRQGATMIQAQFPHRKLFYTARLKAPHNSHKAGNLNHALEFFNTLPGTPAQFFAGIDADMIVEKRWLRAQIGYLMVDPQLAFTCPPPRFYNLPVNDPLSQSLLIFQRYEEIVKDRAGFPWCTGSGWIMRRTALDQIGGFPDGSLTEDLLCGNLLLGKGWKAAYAMETLQWGLVPDSYFSHIQQRKRWSVGASQAGILMRLCLFGPKARGMDVFQRIFGFFYPMQSIASTLGVLGVLGYLVSFSCGISAAQYTNEEELKRLIRLSCLTYLFYFVRLCKISVLGGFAATFREMVQSHFLIPYFAYDHWKTFILPQWLGGRPEPFSARFVATGSIIDDLKEWDSSQRAPFSRRLKSVMIKDGAIFQTLIAFAHIVGVGLNLRRAFALHEPNTKEFHVYLLTRIFWVPVSWPLNIAVFLRPLQYILFPPSVADRESLLVRGENGVAYPKASARIPQFTHVGLGMELFWCLQTSYVLLMLVGTLYW